MFDMATATCSGLYLYEQDENKLIKEKVLNLLGTGQELLPYSLKRKLNMENITDLEFEFQAKVVQINRKFSDVSCSSLNILIINKCFKWKTSHFLTKNIKARLALLHVVF